MRLSGSLRTKRRRRPRRRCAAMLLVLLSPVPLPCAAFAAPTCEDRLGQTVRCDAKSAMPVGWKAPEFDRIVPEAGNRRDMVIAAGAIILLLALIALLPDFGGGSDDDWEPKG